MEYAPPPRSCQVTKWPDFQGYGFNLRPNKELKLQEIGNVEAGSPAEAAGLRPKDLIIEVNGINVTRENHKQVVERIKASGDSTTFLVADQQCKMFHDEVGNVISSSMPNVVHISSARDNMASRKSSTTSSSSSSEEEEVHEKNKVEEQVTVTNVTETVPLETVQEDEESSSSSDESSSEDEDVTMTETSHPASNDIIITEETPTVTGNDVNRRQSMSSTSSNSSETSVEEKKEEENKFRYPAPQLREKAGRTQYTPSQRWSYVKGDLVDGLNLNLSVKEMRARVDQSAQQQSWKRNDHRLEKGPSFKEKCSIFKKLLPSVRT